MDNVIAIGVVVGIINAVQKQFPQVAGIIGIGLSVVIGVVLGYFNYLGVNGIESGIIVGLASSGAYKLATKIGGN